jgi:hypothetical protein
LLPSSVPPASDHREPTLKIVCPCDYSRKLFGLFCEGCPNLLWELMRTRRQQLSAAQLTRKKNPTEAIVDKDDYLRDALKYILLSLPSPSEVPKRLQRDDMIAEAIANGRQATLGVVMARYDAKRRAECEPVS